MFTSPAVARSAGRSYSILEINFWHCRVALGYLYFPLFIDANSSLSSFPYKFTKVSKPLNGKLPVIIMQSNTPRDQISTGLPRYSCRETISGAMQEGVPQYIDSLVSDWTMTLNPKSISLIYKPISSNIRMFSNLTSRWTT